MPEPVFELYKDKKWQVWVWIESANGENITVSEDYASKEGCLI